MITVYDLLSTLKQTRNETMRIIQQLDLEDVVYLNSGWRVHDILTHLTWSDEQAVSIINSFLADQTYHPPSHLHVNSRSDVHRRNAWVRRQRYHKNPQEVMTELIQAHEDLKSAMFNVDTKQLREEFSVYWGDRITIQTLVIWQIQHDQHHRRDLARRLGYPDGLDNRIYSLIYSEA
jgi:hypothetical protein